jgi:hypothetical protein
MSPAAHLNIGGIRGAGFAGGLSESGGTSYNLGQEEVTRAGNSPG